MSNYYTYLLNKLTKSCTDIPRLNPMTEHHMKKAILKNQQKFLYFQQHKVVSSGCLWNRCLISL